VNDDPTFERVNRPAAEGGGYTITYFSDDEGFPARKSRATRVEVLSFDAAGRDIGRTYRKAGPAAAEDGPPR
jgi:hypothetical protein